MALSRTAIPAVAVLALVARMAVPTGGEGGSPADQTKGGGKAQTALETVGTPPPYEGPWLATRHFWAASEAPPPSLPDSSSGGINFRNPGEVLSCSSDPKCRSELRRFFGSEGTDIQCLLATVPDPFRTRLALFTDHSIGGIRRGARAAKWAFATQWLPWRDAVDPNEGDPAKRASERSDVRDRLKQPGALVFRPEVEDWPKPHWGKGALVIFVVGETPTAGVNPDQFQIARAYMQALCDPGEQPEHVRIMGPTFSGSFYSLANLIVQDKNWKQSPDDKYEVQSGTAQGPGVAEAFENQAGVKFHSATDNLRDQDWHFRCLLDELRIPPERAAVLAEAESTFGRAAASAASEVVANRILPESGSGEAACRITPGERIRVFRYPRDISHLRDAYRQVIQESKSPQAPVPNLDFSLKDSGVGADSVPTYSQTQTPLSQNGVINEIARAIRRERIQIVEMSATNVLDLLFLAGVLRRQCPDTRLLIQSADLLFVQAEQSQPLSGILFLTSYPLFAGTKLRDGRDDMEVFPDTLSQGVFNATVLLLAEPCERGEKLVDYAWESVEYPPAWLLTLDRRGFTPVRLWYKHPTQKAQDWFRRVWEGDGKLDFRAVGSPAVFKFLSIVFAIFSVFMGIRVFKARLAPPESEDSWRGFYLFLFLLMLIGIQIAIGVARPWASPIFLLAGCAVPAGVALNMAFRHWRPGQPRWLATWLGAAAVLSGVLLWTFCCMGEEPRRRLFSFRAAELRFGSSPLWPILAAAVALLLWCILNARRLHFAFGEEPEAMANGMETLLNGRLKALRDQFQASARSPLGFTGDQRFWFIAALAALALLGWLFRWDVQLVAILGSIDGARYDILCISLQVLVAGLLLLSCRHILALWKPLHCFAANLTLLPLARAFAPVSHAGGSRPIWVRRLDLQALDIHTRSVDILHDMGLQGAQLAKVGMNAAQVELWHTQYNNRIDDALRVGFPQADSHRRLWRFSSLAPSQLWKRILAPAWEPSPKPEEPAADAKKPAAPDDPKSVVGLAESFVALHYTLFLLYGVRQISNLLWFPSIGFVLLMFSMSCYNFQAPHLIGRLLLVLFAVIAFMLGTCIAEMERDPILSRIAGTEPGELNTAFYLKLARYGALPVLGLLAAQFPWMSSYLLSWLEPALEALQ